MSNNEHTGRMEDATARPMLKEAEVAVVGAGPVGLTMATMLAAYGIRCVVLDRAAEPAGHSRAAVIHARTLETLESLGVVDEALREGVVVPHFGVRDSDRRLLAVDFGGLPTAHPYTLMLPQDETERLLRGALGLRGGKILWGHEVTEMSQDTSRVELAVRSARGSERLRARYVVGCDGAHSTVRETLGIRFEGATYPQSFALADVRMDWGLPNDEVQLFFSPDGLVVVAPLPHEQHRVVATVDEAPPEPSLADVQALLDVRGPRTPRPQVEEIVWSSRFRVHHRVAAAFREGAVFLCGDAAHVHSPAGGQGMNTGIQDAHNLAWKLALVIRGQASGPLLDSYERERMQVAQGVVSMTDRMTRLATVRSPVARRLRNLLIAGACRGGWLPRRLATNLAEIDISYQNGWSIDDSTTVERWAPKGEGSIPSSDPALRLVVPEAQEARAATDAARFPNVPVRVVPRSDVAGAVVVRPDGYVAGRSTTSDYAALLDLLARALGGKPTGSRANILPDRSSERRTEAR
ncbi:MAG: FAD-dependent monooxygenase [Actinobacteria bacterium]|nr:FAD-dependent monooxygenase [Actinomycetota bacterium]